MPQNLIPVQRRLSRLIVRTAMAAMLLTSVQYVKAQESAKPEKPKEADAEHSLPGRWSLKAATVDGKRILSDKFGGVSLPDGSHLSLFIADSQLTHSTGHLVNVSRRQETLKIDQTRDPWTYTNQIIGTGSVTLKGNVLFLHDAELGEQVFDVLEFWSLSISDDLPGYGNLSDQFEEIRERFNRLAGQGLSEVERQLREELDSIGNQMGKIEAVYNLKCEVTSLSIRSRLAREAGDEELADLLEEAKLKKKQELGNAETGDEDEAEQVGTLLSAAEEQGTGKPGDDFPPGEHPFDGYWKLHSARDNSGRVVLPPSVMNQIYIKDRYYYNEGRTSECIVRKIGDQYEVDFDSQTGSLHRYQNVQMLTFSEPGTTYNLEFWRVDPERKKVLDLIKTRHAEVSELQKEGRDGEATELQQQIARLNKKLERIDRIPEIDSLTLRALRARATGDHKQAKEFEQQAEALRIQLAASDEASDKQPVKTDLNELSDELREAETTSREIASRLRKDTDATGEGERASIEASLRKQVTAAFEARWQLQEAQLNRAQSELIELRQKHQRRKELADEIIKRRIKALLEGDETSWLQTNSSGVQNSDPQNGVSSIAGARSARPSLLDANLDETVDPELKGQWKLESITGPGVLSHEQDLILEVSNQAYTLVRESVTDGRSDFKVLTDKATSPPRLLLTSNDGEEVLWRGIYRIEGDTLTIAFSGTMSTQQPIDFSGKTGTLQTFQRIVPLPDFETPQQLVDFMVKVGGAGGGDAEFDQYIQLLTEEEQKRFAGTLLVTISMMEAVSGLAMLAPQMGGEVEPEAAQGLAMIPKLTQLISKHTLANPPTEAKAMFDILRSRFQPMAMMMGAASALPPTPVDEFSKQLRLASGILKDPVAFCREAMVIMQAMDAGSTNQLTGTTSEDWNIVVTGNTATAQQKRKLDDKDDSSPETLELARIGNTWKITSMMSDQTLAELAQGPTISDSDDEESSEKPQ